MPCRNVENIILKAIQSLFEQSFENFSCIIYSDASTDNTVPYVDNLIRRDSRFSLIEGTQRVYAAKARWTAIKSIKHARDNDVVVFVDGDDHLYSPVSLQLLMNKITSKKLLAMHGNYALLNGEACPWSKDYPESVKKANGYRKHPWVVTHPRAFRYGLFKYLSDNVIKDPNGDYYKCATDMALFLPVLELSGTRTAHNKNVLYVYNDRNGYAFTKLRMGEQKIAEEEIKAKQGYSPLPYEEIKEML